MKYFFAIILAIVLPGICLAEDKTDSVSSAVLVVKVIDSTAKGCSVLGDAVIVRIYEHKELKKTLRGRLDADGKAVFDDVAVSDCLIAFASVTHENTKFSAYAVQLKPTQKQFTANIHIFDVSYENSKLSVQTHHFIIKQKDDSLVVTEYMQLINASGMAIGSEKKDSKGRAVVLEVTLPGKFKNFNSSSYLIQDSSYFTEDGFYVTAAVPPGEHQLIFSYTLDISSETMDIVKKISLPTASFVLFSQLGRGNIQQFGDADGQVVLADGAMAEYYNRTDLPAGTAIAFKVAGLSFNTERTPWIIVAVVFLVIAILAVLRLRPTKSQV